MNRRDFLFKFMPGTAVATLTLLKNGELAESLAESISSPAPVFDDTDQDKGIYYLDPDRDKLVVPKYTGEETLSEIQAAIPAADKDWFWLYPSKDD